MHTFYILRLETFNLGISTHDIGVENLSAEYLIQADQMYLNFVQISGIVVEKPLATLSQYNPNSIFRRPRKNFRFFIVYFLFSSFG